MALNAYNSRNTSEAYQYFLKVLELDPSDYQSVFYKGMCQGWETTLANPRVGEAVHAYQIASEMIPAESIETATAIKESFIIDLTNLIDVWFTKARERYWDVEDWYSSNVSVFWDCLEVAEKVIEYIDNYKDCVLSRRNY